MQLFKKQIKTFYNLFSPKRAFLVLFLAVLVLGFSVKSSFAAKLPGPAPPPGTVVKDLPADWKSKATDIWGGQYQYGLTANGPDTDRENWTVGKGPFEYENFLKNVGGYSDAEAFQTASQIKDQLKVVGLGDEKRLAEYTAGKAGDAFTYSSTAKEAAPVVGGKILEVAGKGVLLVVIGVLSVIASFLKEFVSYAAQLLDLTLNPSLYNFTSNKMIVQGWTMVRDVCNLFFLLILLFITICTILKIEKYHAKKTLLTLIIMALLINFSKPIAIFIFDGSQLLMNEFLKQMGGTQGTGQTTSTVVAKASRIANIVYDTLPKNSGETPIAIQYLFGVVFLFMLMVAYLVTALMLIIRIVVIMMLIIVSPFAFFAAIIPDFSKMSSSWWSSLFEYSYYGPAAAFFLLLATKLEDALPPLQNISGTNGKIDVTVNSIIQNVLVLVFLYASIIMAKKFGGVAGAAVVGNANRFMKWGARMGGTGLLAAGTLGQYWRARDAAKGTLQGISQRSGMSWLTKAGREKTSKERQERAAERFAPFNISNVKKKSEEMKNDDIKKVNAGVDKGDAASILQAASRGKLTAAQLKNPKVRALMKKYADFEGSVYKNLRDTGNGHVQYADMVNRGSTTAEAFEKTYKDLSFNNMAEKGSLKQALVTENASGGADDIFQKLDKIKDPTTINNLKARSTNGETFNVMQKLHDYRVWESTKPIPFTGPPPAGFVGVPSPATLKAYLMA